MTIQQTNYMAIVIVIDRLLCRVNPTDEHLFARFAASSPIMACDQESCRYTNVLKSGNEAI